MNVVYYSSDFFSEICGVSIQSLCECNKDVDDITIYIVENHISNINKQRIKSITDNFGRTIVFIQMPLQEELYPNVKINLGRTFARMALGEILPKNIDRVLSLDSDTLVMDSLNEMYQTKFLKNEYVAGVYDCVGKAIQTKILQMPNDLKYCNAGMFLIDMKKWRQMNVGQQLLQAVVNNSNDKKILYFLEQDLMNIIFYGHLKLLKPRYNMLTSIYLFNYYEILKMKKPVTYYLENDVEMSKAKPALIHATTCFYVKRRMWVDKSDHPYSKFYLEYRNRTPWKDVAQIKDSRKMSKKIYAQFWHCIPKEAALLIASIMINYIRPLYAFITTKVAISTIANQSST